MAEKRVFGENHPKVSALNFNGNVFGVISVCFCFVFLVFSLFFVIFVIIIFIFKYSQDLRVKVNSIFFVVIFFVVGVKKMLNILREVVSSRTKSLEWNNRMEI